MNKINLNIQIICKTKNKLPSKNFFKFLLKTVLSKFKKKCEINIRIVDKNESRYLNFKFCGKNKATNVLSFSFEPLLKIKSHILGDIIICKQLIIQEAIKQKKNLNEHWAHIIIHGCLHLLGFNHIKINETKKMEYLEKKFLKELGYSNKY
ncbi:rRNA maturation RNase YbeY [Candidatus Providencia siddallii]|uniref:Endoribonuclease YbeY n=1 Tax=Candidatus Providencia siddallii TaxID=1715285 RepID=A0ABM9NNF9_9GAMM